VPRAELRHALAPAALEALDAALRSHFAYVVYILGSSLEPDTAAGLAARALLPRADHTLLVAAGDIVGLSSARLALRALHDLQSDGPGRARPLLVLGRYARTTAAADPAGIAAALRVPVAAAIPRDDAAAQQALASHRPLVALGRGRRGGAARALCDLAERLHAEHAAALPRRHGPGARLAAALRRLPARLGRPPSSRSTLP
jgi:Flp pilus assembly CpaE family ATPase